MEEDNQQVQLKNDFLNQHAEHFINGIATSLFFRLVGIIDNNNI